MKRLVSNKDIEYKISNDYKILLIKDCNNFKAGQMINNQLKNIKDIKIEYSTDFRECFEYNYECYFLDNFMPFEFA